VIEAQAAVVHAHVITCCARWQYCTKVLVLSDPDASAAVPAAYHALAVLAGMCSSVLLCSPHAALTLRPLLLLPSDLL